MKIGLKQANVYLFAFQALTAIGYGFRVISEAGTDFGIYYLGGVGSNRNFELYGDFFEHKGPTFYAFIKLLALVIPFGTFGAGMTLAFTAMVWFICINRALSVAKIQNFSTVVIVKLLSVSLLLGQSSNSSIFLFGSGLAILGTTYLVDFTLRPRFKIFLTSIVLLSLAVLTKLDSLAVLLPCFILTLRIRKRKFQFISMYWVSFLAVTGILIVVFSLLLPYRLRDAFYSTIEFVLTVRWNSENLSTTDLVFNANLFTFLPSVASGIILTIIVIFKSCLKSRTTPMPLILFSLYGLIVFLTLVSSKSYHLFDFYTFAIIGILLQAKSSEDILGSPQNSLAVYLFVVSLILNYGYSQEVKCLFDAPKCTTRFSALLAEDKLIQESEYFLSQGWPYIILEKFPEANPNVYWPLAVNTGSRSTNLIRTLRDSQKIMWFDSNDLNFIRKNNPKLYKSLFMKMKLVDEVNDGQWVALKNY